MQIIRTISVTFTLATALLAADNSFIGTWKLNVEKSTFGPGMEIKSLTLTFKSEGQKTRRIAEGTDGQDKPIVQGGPDGVAFAWDGKKHKVIGNDEPVVIITADPVVHGATDVTVQIQGKVVSHVHAAVAKDGNTLTETHHDADDKGRFIDSVMVFEKQ